MGVKFCLVSLGCAKNLVDSEQMLSKLFGAGYELVEDPEKAELAVVNTCAFIEDAKKEAVENILEMARYKNTGTLRALVVAGCMAQRYREEIFRELPEVDAVVGCGSYGRIAEICGELLDPERQAGPPKLLELGDIDGPVEEAPRVRTTPFYTAYLKIAEGCDNHCAYCVIPSLRGPYRSRELEKIVDEARALAADGVRELILVAQDTSRYGTDLYGRHMLPELLRRLCAIGGVDWIRLHYLYPDEVDDELIDVIAAQPKVLKYVDMPIQHASDRLLRTMNRRYTRAQLEALIRKLRQRVPGVVLRTSVIVGLPGETEEDFEELCRFAKEVRIERAGVFQYSREEGTPAYDMENQIDEVTKRRRMEHLLDLQSDVVDVFNEGRLGSVQTVLCEGYDRAAGCFYGRSYAESPDIDGKVFFMAEKRKPKAGELVSVKITETIDGDVLGELVEPYA